VSSEPNQRSPHRHRRLLRVRRERQRCRRAAKQRDEFASFHSPQQRPPMTSTSPHSFAACDRVRRSKRASQPSALSDAEKRATADACEQMEQRPARVAINIAQPKDNSCEISAPDADELG
jgi:hypothetical protein